MKTATVRQLRHAFPEVLRWVEQGEQVRISKRGKVVAVLCPPKRKTPKPKQVRMPDFAARLRERYPNGPIPGKPLAEHLGDERDHY